MARPSAVAASLLAIALAGCGSSPTSPSTGPTPAPTPTPTPAPNDVVLVTADPQIGSTISLAARSTASLSLLLYVAAPGPLELRALLTEQPPTPGTDCRIEVVSGPFGPGAAVADTETLDLSPLAGRCALPQPVTLDLLLDDGRNTAVLKEVRSIYTVVP